MTPAIAGPRRLRSADSPEPGPQGTAPPGAAPQGTATQGASQRGTDRRGTAAPGAEPETTGHASTIERLIGQVPGKRPGSGTETFTASAGQLARDNVLESVAILLLGLGGLILPFPFWPIGAIVAMFSRIWDVKDKSVAVIGPMLVTLALSVIAAPFVGGSGNVIVVYFHALARVLRPPGPGGLGDHRRLPGLAGVQGAAGQGSPLAAHHPLRPAGLAAARLPSARTARWPAKRSRPLRAGKPWPG